MSRYDGGRSIIQGTSGNAVDVNEDGQMHVVMQGKPDTGNSTGTPLTASQTFTGTSIDVSQYAAIGMLATATDAGGLGGTMVAQFSPDEVTWYDGETYILKSGAEKFFTPTIQALYFRVVYTNNAADQSSICLFTMLHKNPIKWSSHNIDDPIVDEDDATLTKAVITGKKVNGIYDNVSLTNNANMKVSLEEVEPEVTQTMAAFSDNIDGDEGIRTASALYGRVDDTLLVPIKVDGSTQDLQVVEHEHAEIHGGDHYFYEDYAEIDAAATIDFCIQTPDTTKWSHLVWEIAAQGQFTFEIYEGATITYDGTDLTSYNNDRNSSNVSNWVNFEQDSTVVAPGTRLGGMLLGDAINPVRSMPGGGNRSREVILKQNTNYLFRITSGVNDNNISYLAEWYEHTNRN